MNDTIKQLMDLAEDRMRLRGFHAVSFRDLADELGIKSSSVHYYFPQKQNLGVALVERYAEEFFNRLDTASKDASNAEDHIKAIASVYREALFGSDRMCLCGMLGAESAGLPEEVARAVSKFLQANIEWLADKLADCDAPAKSEATRIIATLQGAMLLSNSLGDKAVFDDAVAGLLS